LQPELHHKSICELPKWSNGEYFDAFHKGVVQNESNDTLSVDFLEGLMDNCRYFAEGCDHLRTIEIVTEHTGGVAGLTTSLLQSLRDEFAGSVCIPVWCANSRKLDEQVLKYDGATLLDNLTTMQNRMSVLDSALFYHRVMEHASAVVPISLTHILQGVYGVGAVPNAEGDNRYNKYISTAAAAAALNAACTYQCTPRFTSGMGSVSALHYQGSEPQEQHSTQVGWLSAGNDPRMQSSRDTVSRDNGEVNISSAHQWCAMATLRGRLPMCFLEASFPGILTNPELTQLGEYPGLEQHLVDAFDPRKREVKLKKGAGSGLRTVNPFATSLSPLPQWRGGADEAEEATAPRGAAIAEFPFARAFTNMLSVRGTSSPGMYFLHCRSFDIPPKLKSLHTF
jgi:hypothetical protein